eukprot:6526751-Lingulodinium_polyedra.AAC.1
MFLAGDPLQVPAWIQGWAHPSHRLGCTGGAIWCETCGGTASRPSCHSLLRVPCREYSRRAPQAARLAAGRHHPSVGTGWPDGRGAVGDLRRPFRLAFHEGAWSMGHAGP